MNKLAYEIMARKRRRDERDGRGDYADYHLSGEYDGRYDRRYDRDYNDDYARDRMYDRNDYGMDYAQGVKGTGRYGIGGSRYYPRRDRAMEDMREEDMRRRDYRDMRDYGDYRDYGYDHSDYRDYRDYRDYADQKMRLTESDMMKWKSKLINANGTRGEHFDKKEIASIAERMGIRYDNFNEKELCMAANMLYSDYCLDTKPFVTSDKEPYFYVAMAKSFLEDKDASAKGGEKLYIYYNWIVDDEE